MSLEVNAEELSVYLCVFSRCLGNITTLKWLINPLKVWLISNMDLLKKYTFSCGVNS